MVPATALTRTLPARTLTYRGCLRASPSPFQRNTQRRWLGLKYIAKLQKADEQWRAKAQEIKEGKRPNLFDILDERGFIKDVVGSTKDKARETFRLKRVFAYAGVDPTASSLHLGHLIAFMPLFWMYLHGYGGFSLIGASTAKIGDPTGRTEGRPEMGSAQLVQNLAGIHHQLKALWQNVESTGTRFGYKWEWSWTRAIVNNNAWWNKRPMLEVLKRLGSHVRVGPMLSRDNVKSRLKEGTGMSFAEFTYPLMQGWDWYELYKQRGVQMQIGGSDQYGNILTGIECVKHCVQSEPDNAAKLPSGALDQPFGLTVPLLTDSSGAKFGKSAGNAMWLDPFQTTPYDLYGYLVRRSDQDVERFLKLLTFHPLNKIAAIMKEHNQDPKQRVAQHTLAHEVLWLIHGKIVADNTQREHKSMYGKAARPQPADQTKQTIDQYTHPEGKPVTAGHRPRVDIKLPRHLLHASIPRLLYACGMASSLGDGDRSVKAGGIYLGGAPGAKGLNYQTGMLPEQLQFVPVRAWDPAWNDSFLIDDAILLLRKGKHNLRCIEFVSDEEWKTLGLQYPGQPGTGAFRTAVNKLNEAVKAAGEAKRLKGKLDEEDKVEVALGKEMAFMKGPRLREYNDRVKSAKRDGLVKKDPYAW